MKILVFIFLCLSAVCALAGCQNQKPAAQPEIAKAEQNTVPQVNQDKPQNISPSPTPEKEEKTSKAGLVELVKLDDSIKLDIRYATTNNFVGRQIYKEARAFMQKPAAEALVRIHQNLKKRNLGLVVFDGYRPHSATRLFWQVTSADKRKFVANPKEGSRHNRGCAVDLGLFDLQTGENLEMPSEYDNFTERAAIDYAGGTEQQRKNRALLRETMESEDFKVYRTEWWHYDFQSCPENRILDIEFSDIK